ncbi:molybdate ABC transporter substrate-binding protein [Sulfurovum sp.]|jgi:molybdate transport system substrate-binding protein|uniref:molybdate ABC transporter substrate-binding protein n=1 Tax=Sulfurovum sp. TaxID=1969726 RepID=UPI002A36BF7E|nr:molybdate ABC transporter substrate-binding protein [Sulfurovum sp.]MDY0403402.1 molybdate ABC transporter substrate-binding protein [Sulfurovum sp.]
MKKILLVLCLSLVSLNAGEIKIAVAANVSYAMDELKKAFHALYPETKVQVTLGSSGKLTAQIKNGAPYQLFMAANMKYPEALYKDGIAVTRPLVYAQGSLAYLSNKQQDFTKGIALIKDATIHKIAVANPKTAPYGKAAIEAMKNGGVLEETEKKFVYAESISQTVSYAVTAADIGFIAKSSLYSPKMAHFKEEVNWADVDPKLYTPINQGIVVLKNGEKNSEVAAFYTFMLSAKAKEILLNYGYLVP